MHDAAHNTSCFRTYGHGQYLEELVHQSFNKFCHEYDEMEKCENPVTPNDIVLLTYNIYANMFFSIK